MGADLKVELKLLYVQYDQAMDENDRKDLRIEELEKRMVEYEIENAELRDLVFYEPLAQE